MTDLSPLAGRLAELGLMDKAFSGMCRDEVMTLIQAVKETVELDPDDAYHSQMLKNLYAYRHLAPCPRENWNYVYRGQACAACPDRGNCVSWPGDEIPDHIKPLKGVKA